MQAGIHMHIHVAERNLERKGVENYLYSEKEYEHILMKEREREQAQEDYLLHANRPLRGKKIRFRLICDMCWNPTC